MSCTDLDSLDIQKITFENTIEKDLQSALKNLDMPELVTCDLLNGKKQLRLKIKGTLVTRGINTKETQWGSIHTIGLELSDQSMEIMNELADLITTIPQYDENWEMKNMFFKGKWYPKLKIDKDNKNRYVAQTSPKMYPKKPNEDLVKGTEVEIETEVGAWFNLSEDSKKAGIYFSFNKIHFQIDEEEAPQQPTPKRLKKEKV